MNKEIKQMIRDLLSDDELWNLAAQSCKKSVDALIGAGFSRNEAIRIFMRQGPIVKSG